MKDQTQALATKLKPVINLTHKYLTFSIILFFLLIYTILILRIDNFSSASPTQDQISGKQQSISHPKVDPKVLSKIQQLQNQNIQVRTLFNQARNNPFSE